MLELSRYIPGQTKFVDYTRIQTKVCLPLDTQTPSHEWRFDASVCVMMKELVHLLERHSLGLG